MATKDMKVFTDDLDDLTVNMEVLEPTTGTPSMTLFSKVERDLIELALSNQTVETIALRLALPKSMVLQLLARKEVQEHLKLLSESMNQMETLRIKGLCERMIDEKIALAEETDSALSKKDTLDIIKVYADILAAERKSKAPNPEENIYISILNQVMR